MAKQPYRNAILKTMRVREALKKKMFDAEELFQEAEEVADLTAQAEDENLKKSAELQSREEKITHLEKMLRDEMRRTNKYHPAIGGVTSASKSVSVSVDLHTAMNHRFFGPMIDWNDSNDRGIVTFAFNDDHGNTNHVCHGVSLAALRDFRGDIEPQMIKDYSHIISTELTRVMLDDLNQRGFMR